MLTLTGMANVMGVVLTQGVVLILVINDYIKQGFSASEAFISAAPLRLRPILMAQTTTILELLPLDLKWGEGGDILCSPWLSL